MALATAMENGKLVYDKERRIKEPVHGGNTLYGLAVLQDVCAALGIDPHSARVTNVSINFSIDEKVYATIRTLPTDKQLASLKALYDENDEP